MIQTKVLDLFNLDPSITFLNHGSFGACPKSVFEDYQAWQLKLEEEPIQFITKTGVAQYRKAKEVFAKEFKCSTDDFFLTPNPSTAFNTVIQSLDLKEGDEILTTDLEYGAMDRTWALKCKRSGAKYVQQHISLPIQSKESFLDQFWAGLSPRTKIVFISHITSATALILPVEDICQKAKELGLIVMVDGAHVPGHISLNLDELDADYYTGALHKWYLAPKGCSFLHVKKEHQDSIDPLIVSWGYESDHPSHSQFLDYHEYSGTRDFSAYLTLPALKEFWLTNDWKNKANEARKALHQWYPKFCVLLNTFPICPINENYLGQMCSIPISTDLPDELKDYLYDNYQIEISITNRKNEFFLRISYQAYNTAKDLQYLYDTLETIKNEGIYLQ